MAMDNKVLDAFILFNEREGRVTEVVSQLEKRGVSTYLWRRDIPIGTNWSELEASHLTEARCVLVFLGDHGWGPNHEKIAEQAHAMGKRMLPVLVGLPAEAEFERVGNLFRRLRYVDLRELNENRLDALVEAIHAGDARQAQNAPESVSEFAPNSARFDRIIDLLVDGNDEQRAATLESIRVFRVAERPALAARLRHEITQRFHPGSETNFATSVRDPKRTPSVRSWMLSALIWLDAESLQSRELILKHLRASQEDDRNVRFWVLAGLGQSRASYLGDAISLSSSDDAAELSSLAAALASPTDQSMIARFRDALASSDFERNAWPVLRVLRIVPIPDLALNVANLLARDQADEPWHYDAVYALSLPEMAKPAAKALSDTLGVEAVVTIVLRALRGSNFNASVASASFLSAFDRQRAQRALAALRFDPILGDLAARISATMSRAWSESAGQRELSVAGYASDTIDPRFDRLDIARDVRTLTAVMLAEEVKPPLAIGLFGDWGSGKSFFMKSIRVAARDLAERTKKAGKTNFCTEIVQIEFNAWHYADTNLWASLVDYILEKLAAKVSPEKTPEEKQAEILADLGSTKGIVEQAKNEMIAFEGLIAVKQKDLEKLRIDRETKEIELRDLKIADFKALVQDAHTVGLDTALKELGVPQAVGNVKELADVVAETNTVRGQMTAMLHAILNQKSPLVFWGLLLVTLFGIPLLTWGLNAALKADVVGGAMAAAAEIGALITATAAVMRNGLSKVKDHLATIDEARKRIQRLLDEKRKNPKEAEVNLREEIAGLSSKEHEAANRLSIAVARVVELEEKIKALTEGRSLARFITERRQSQDYQRHLGLISTIRKDFQSLEEKLASVGKDGDPTHRVDRIILYIDDLDRCPSDKVLEVLQAVHLLLAFPLFVVVVGVDPRWLRHSLGKAHSALRSDLDDHDDENRDGQERRVITDRRRDSRATPQNYLEKIFQIPFSLHRMTETGYGDLVEALLLPSTGTRTETRIGAPGAFITLEPEAGGAQGSGSHAAESAGIVAAPLPQQAGGTEEQSHPHAGGPVAPATTATFIISDEALHIQRWEGYFARRLFTLIPTPRSAKRLSNVYRILKASVTRDDIKHFEGTEVIPGEFQLPMLLLAMIIKAPAECSLIFTQLLRRIEEGHEAIVSLRNLEVATHPVDAEANAFRELRELILPFVSDPAFPTDNAALLRWIPQVSRFSFEIGGMLQR